MGRCHWKVQPAKPFKTNLLHLALEDIVNACIKVYAYLIFVTGTTGVARGEKNRHVEKFVHMTDCQVEKLFT